MLPNNSSKSKGLTGNAIRTWGFLFLLLGIAGQSIIQNRILGLGSVTTADLLAAMEANPNLMPMATLALVFQAIQTCAAPIFSFLLVEGFMHTSNRKNYLIRVLCVALASELPYNLAMSGRLFDLSSRNPVFGLVLGMITLMFYTRYQDPTMGHRLIKFAITVAGMVWCTMLGISDGGCLVLLIATFWGFRFKHSVRNMAAMGATCLCSLSSIYYLAAPLAVLPLYLYNDEPGPQNQKFNYAAYPAALLALGLIAKFF